MTTPAVVQTSTPQVVQGFSGAQTHNMPGAMTAGNNLLVFVLIKNPNISVEPSLVSGITVNAEAMTRYGDYAFQYESNKVLSVWYKDGITGTPSSVSITPGVADSSNEMTVCAVEVDSNDSGTFAPVNVVHNTSENAAADLVLGPTGTFVFEDNLLFAVVSNNNGSTADIGWITPSGWTASATQPDGTSGKYTLAVYTKQNTGSTTAVSVTTDSTTDDVYGRNGVIFAIRGSSAGLTKKVKIFATASAASVANVIVDVFPAADTGLCGSSARYFTKASNTFEASLESGKAVLKVADSSINGLAVDDPVVVVGQTADGTKGWRGVVVGTIIEE